MTKISAYRLHVKTLASIAIGLTSFVVAACSSTNGISGGNVVPAHAVRPLTQPTATPTPYQYTYSTVDDEGGSTTFTHILGMDDYGAIVGYYTNGSITKGFNSFPPYTKFRVVDYPNSASTVATSMSEGNQHFAGYYQEVAKGAKTWGWIRYKGVWEWYQDPHVPKGPGSVTEFLGINNNVCAVGFYIDANNNPQPLYYSDRRFAGLHPPNAVSAKATGINLRGDIVGSEVLANGSTIGWIYRDGNYSTFSYPNSNDTEPTNIDFADQVVGSYTDSSSIRHGFIVSGPSNPQTARWQSIDEPSADGTTVVTDINNHHTIVGWYVDAAGNNNGFVATAPSK